MAFSICLQINVERSWPESTQRARLSGCCGLSGNRRSAAVDQPGKNSASGDITEYSGVYQVADWCDEIDLRIGSDGSIPAHGHDSDQPSRTFVLENAGIEGAVLTAIKVYRDGATARFEGVFLTRTERSSPTDSGVTTSGMGVVLTTPREFPGRHARQAVLSVEAVTGLQRDQRARNGCWSIVACAQQRELRAGVDRHRRGRPPALRRSRGRGDDESDL